MFESFIITLVILTLTALTATVIDLIINKTNTNDTTFKRSAIGGSQKK